MKITRGYKTELDPTVKQHMLLCQCTGTARFAYNYGLARKQEVYKESGKFISAIDLQKELTARKHTDLPWLKGVSKWLVQKKAELRKQYPGTAYFNMILDKLNLERSVANRAMTIARAQKHETQANRHICVLRLSRRRTPKRRESPARAICFPVVGTTRRAPSITT